MSLLAPGSAAPDLTLRSYTGEPVRLSAAAAAGKGLVVVFFPFAFSGICTGELDHVRDHLGDFLADDLDLAAVSCDPVYSLRAWADARGYFFPLLSDFWPHGAAARAFGVFAEHSGRAERGTFLLDRDGVVRFAEVNPAGEARDFAGLRDAVGRLRVPAPRP